MLAAVGAAAGRAFDSRAEDRVAPNFDPAELDRRLASYDFAAPRPVAEVTDDMLGLLRDYAVRSDHQRYFGLFNPPSLPAAVAGDLVASAVNPQLAVWSHAP